MDNIDVMIVNRLFNEMKEDKKVTKSFADFFLELQKTPWYHQFLHSAVNQITAVSPGQRLLDVGTGPGVLLQILACTYPELSLTGIDPNQDMLEKGRLNLLINSARLVRGTLQELSGKKTSGYDWITFCSVLYLLTDPYAELAIAHQLLNSKGTIIILTPTAKFKWIATGKQAVLTPTLFGKGTILLWRWLTHGRSVRWSNRQIAYHYADQAGLSYSRMETFNGLAMIETLTQP